MDERSLVAIFNDVNFVLLLADVGMLEFIVLLSDDNKCVALSAVSSAILSDTRNASI